MKNNILTYTIALVLSAFLFNSCNDKPTSIGINLLQDTVELYGISSDEYELLTGSATNKRYPTGFSLDEVLFGKSGNTEAILAIRFDIPDTLDYLNPTSIISSKLKIYPSHYAYGNYENGIQSFSIKEITKFWFRTNSNPDSNYTYEDFANDPTFFGREIATYNSQFPIPDSVDVEAIEFDFPEELLDEWTEVDTTYEQNPDNPSEIDTIISLRVHWGIAFLPNEASEVISQINAQNIPGETNPEDFTRIEVIYNHKDGYIDTTFFNSAVEAIFANSPTADEDDKLVVQGVVEQRGRVFFDVSQIPELAGVHKAELVMHRDESKTVFGNNGADAVFLARAYNNGDEELGATFTGSFSDTTNTNKIIFPSIAQAIQIWVRQGGTGYFELTPSTLRDQINEIDRTEFYGVNASEANLRPKITIIYSLQPRDDNE